MRHRHFSYRHHHPQASARDSTMQTYYCTHAVVRLLRDVRRRAARGPTLAMHVRAAFSSTAVQEHERMRALSHGYHLDVIIGAPMYKRAAIGAHICKMLERGMWPAPICKCPSTHTARARQGGSMKGRRRVHFLGGHLPPCHANARAHANTTTLPPVDPPALLIMRCEGVAEIVTTDFNDRKQ